MLISIHENSRRRLFSQGILILLASLWMVASYYFILQPVYDTPQDALHSDVPINDTVDYIIDENTAYLKEQADSTYTLYYKDIAIEKNISSDDVETGLYNLYPIIEYKRNTELFKNKFFSFFENLIFK